MFITKRKLNKKLNLLLHRQNMLATVLFKSQLTMEGQKKMEKEWNDIWHKIMEEDNGERK